MSPAPGGRSPAPARREVLGGEQVEGRHAVLELLRAGRRKVRELVVVDRQPDEEATALAAARRVPVRRIGAAALAELARCEAPQGLLARAEPVRPVSLEQLCAPPGAGRPPPFLLLLDGVTDPGNLGALLRSASCAGVGGVVLGRHRAAHLSPAACKAAAGAVEHLDFALVPGPPAALQQLGRLGVWRVGLEAGAPPLEGLAVLAEPLVLVLGAEGRGLGPLSRSRCDLLAGIPMAGPLASLNVAAAAAVACFEVARQRRG